MSVPLRAALYLRVSTARQAEQAYRASRGYQLVETYVEPGASATNERRPEVHARQGFWNGSLPPVGYRVVDAEKRGAKVKKKLEIDPLHADTVRLAFRLSLEVRIMGSRSELLRTLAAASGVRSAEPVRNSVPKWRRGWDSNPR